MMRWVTLLCVGIATLTGCASIEDYHYAIANHRRAELAWKQNNALLDRTSIDYAHGWKQGYFDVCTGGKGVPPAVPPSKYWSPRYQGSDGQLAIEDWYVGYQDGATNAQSTGVGEWHPIYTGPTVPVGSVSWPEVETFPAPMMPTESVPVPAEPTKSALNAEPRQLGPTDREVQTSIPARVTTDMAPHELNDLAPMDGSRRLPPPTEEATSPQQGTERATPVIPNDTPTVSSRDETNLAPPVFTDE